jgi:pimeloyl-ACP methyl ester carboxylesterase
MRLEVDERAVFASDGGKAHEAGQPLIVFLHGAGMDHSVWALQSRWFAHHGRNVLAVDLPGHGGSAGRALTDIGALADWTSRLVAAAGPTRAALVGHSMGALIALETAARHPGMAASLAMIGVAGTMPVHPDLLAAAKANSPDAIAMVSLWSLGDAAMRGANPAPGQWMLGGAERLLEKAGPGVLYADLSACDSYSDSAAAATSVRCPTKLILGEGDLMTPPKAARSLAAAIAGAETIVLAGAGHMLPIERPDEVLAALKRAARG